MVVGGEIQMIKKNNDIFTRICHCMFTIIGWEFGKMLISILENIFQQ